MCNVIEIEAAIEKLPPEKKIQLRHWVIENIPSENDDILMPPAYRQKILDAIEES